MTDRILPYYLRGKVDIAKITDFEPVLRMNDLEVLITKGIIQCGGIEDVSESQFNSWCEEFEILAEYVIASQSKP